MKAMTTETPQLTITLQGQVVQTISLAPGTLTIGRTPDNTVALPHPLVARRHAELRSDAAGVFLTDLESASGTLLNGDRLLPGQPVAVPNGAVIQIGPFSLLLRLAPEEAQAGEAGGEPVAAALRPVEIPEIAAPGDRAPARPRFPALRPLGPYSRYLRDLPQIYHEADFLGRYLLIFESIWEPLQQRRDHGSFYFDPQTCPEPMVNWLGGWLGMAIDPHWPEARRRRLVEEAMDLYRWRGTRYGLTRMLEICTGLAPEVLDDPGNPFVIRIRLRLPAGSGIDRIAIETLIQTHKPAHVGYILEVRP